MSDLTKNVIYLCIGIGIFSLALLLRPSPPEFDESQAVGTILFPDLKKKDIGEVQRLVVSQLLPTKPGEMAVQTLTLQREGSGGWSLGSNAYPISKEKSQRIEQLLTQIAQMTIASVEGETARKRSETGTCMPKEEGSKIEPKNRGLRVEIFGEKNTLLADFVLGDKLEIPQQQQAQCYVRSLPGSMVCVSQINRGDFSAKKTFWVKPELLNLMTLDVHGVVVQKYLAEPCYKHPAKESLATDKKMIEKNEAEFRKSPVDYLRKTTNSKSYYNTIEQFRASFAPYENKWTLKDADILQPVPTSKKLQLGAFVPRPDDALNSDILTELANVASRVKIIAIQAKPKAFVNAVTLPNKSIANKIIRELHNYGFSCRITKSGSEEGGEFPITCRVSPIQRGRLIVTHRDGYEYVINFGNMIEDKAKIAQAQMQNKLATLDIWCFVYVQPTKKRKEAKDVPLTARGKLSPEEIK